MEQTIILGWQLVICKSCVSHATFNSFVIRVLYCYRELFYMCKLKWNLHKCFPFLWYKSITFHILVGIICITTPGTFAVQDHLPSNLGTIYNRRSFAVQFGDHFWCGIICSPGIIYCPIDPSSSISQFHYIKIQLDCEALRTQTKEMNNHCHSISFVCVL